MSSRPEQRLSRRQFLSGSAGALASMLWSPAWPKPAELIRRPVPGHKESLPVIGMGSWITFDIGRNPVARQQRLEVLRAFFNSGGSLVDSSPMYGTSEENIGWCLSRLDRTPVFTATKVWMTGQRRGIEQMQQSQRLWGRPADLMQIHNLVDWQTHLETLREWRAAGHVRYIGVTTSHGRRHNEMEQIIATEKDIDFVQFSYNLADRAAEQRLLPLAREYGKAVIINRPFRRKQLIRALQGQPLPAWAQEYDCANWPQFLLKFIVSHPAVTCVIPATSRPDHMLENMGACHGRLPDDRMRRRMARYFESL